MFFGHMVVPKVKYRFFNFFALGSSSLSEVNLKCINGSFAFSFGLIYILYLRRNSPGNWVILILSGQKPCTRVI